MNALLNDAKQKYSQLPIREQILLAVVTVIIALYLVFMLIWQPLSENRERLHQRNRINQETLNEVKTLVEQYKQASQGGNVVANISLPQLIDQTIRQHQLSMIRFQPGSRGDATVRLENMPFDNVLRWLGELELKHKLAIKEVSITPGKATGLVNVSARVQGSDSDAS
jgi:general secretion pathway protein M